MKPKVIIKTDSDPSCGNTEALLIAMKPYTTKDMRIQYERTATVTANTLGTAIEFCKALGVAYEVKEW